MPRRVRVNSTVLSIAIAQTQIEQIKSPTMTALTIQWACQNSVNSERSEEVSGSTDCATSAGFMGTSFSLDPALEALARDLFRKPVSTFRDHAVVGQTGAAHNA